MCACTYIHRKGTHVCVCVGVVCYLFAKGWMLIRSVLVQGCTLYTSGGVKLSVPACTYIDGRLGGAQGVAR